MSNTGDDNYVREDRVGEINSNTQVSCSAADIKCPWKGSRDELNNHVVTCVFQPLRSILSEFITENQQLKQRMKAQEAEICHLKDQLSKIINAQANNEVSSHGKSSCNNCRDCLYLAAAGSNPAGYYHIYAHNHTTYDYDEEERHGVTISYCKCSCHK